MRGGNIREDAVSLSHDAMFSGELQQSRILGVIVRMKADLGSEIDMVSIWVATNSQTDLTDSRNDLGRFEKNLEILNGKFTDTIPHAPASEMHESCVQVDTIFPHERTSQDHLL